MSRKWAAKFRKPYEEVKVWQNSALKSSMRPIPGSQTEADEWAGKYTHVVYPMKEKQSV